MRRQHASKCHRGELSFPGVAAEAKVVSPKEAGGASNFKWKCPCCRHGLVTEPRTDAGKYARKVHWKEKHPKVPIKKFHVGGSSPQAVAQRAQTFETMHRKATVRRTAVVAKSKHRTRVLFRKFDDPKYSADALRPFYVCTVCAASNNSPKTFEAKPCVQDFDCLVKKTSPGPVRRTCLLRISYTKKMIKKIGKKKHRYSLPEEAGAVLREAVQSLTAQLASADAKAADDLPPWR